MAMFDPTLQEIVGLADDAISVLKTEGPEEIEKIRAIADVKTQLYKAHSQRQENLKDILRKLGDRTQELEGNALSNHREEYMTQYNVLQEHRQKTVENISRMETDIERAKARMAQCKADSVEAEKRHADIERLHQIDLPRVQHKLEMYQNISNIKWDYESPLVSGTVLGKHDARTFEFDPNTQSSFEITNNLWALLDSTN